MTIQFIRNFFTTSGITALSAGVAMVSHSIYLNYLGYQHYGVWLVLTTIMTFAQLGQLGIFSSLTKFIAESRGADDNTGVAEYVSTATGAVLLFSGLTAGVLYVFRSLLLSWFKLQGDALFMASNLLPWIILLSAYVLFVEVSTATLNGLGRMDLSSSTMLAGQIIGLIVSTVGLARGFGANALLVGAITSKMTQHVANMILIRHYFQFWFWSPRIVRSKAQELLRLGIPLMVSVLLNLALAPFNKLMLARFGGLGAVAVYEIAWSASMQLRGVFEAGVRALMPELAFHASKNTNRETINKMTVRALRIALLLGIPIFLGVFFMARPLLHLWLRKVVATEQIIALKIMLVGSFISLLGSANYHSLIAFGRRHAVVASHIVQSVANIAISFLIVFKDGYSLSPAGAALATTCGMACSTVFLQVWWSRHYIPKN